MRRFITRFFQYSILAFAFLEVMVRVFHLQDDKPERFIDSKNVEKMVPGQRGYAVTGNRKQNVSYYNINDSGFNSVHQSYNPTADSLEIAIVGDSFVQGFHEDYKTSLGQKIEDRLPNYKVFEFGYAGYDLADQLHLIESYKELFEKIDHVIIYMRFTDDLRRDNYKLTDRLKNINTPIKKLLKKSKLIVYVKDLGIISSFKKSLSGILIKKPINSKTTQSPQSMKIRNEKYISNFKKLINSFSFDKEKYLLLMDFRLTDKDFLEYLDSNGFNALDYGVVFSKSKHPTTLIYDQHWNSHGRDLIANLIADYYNEK